MNTKGVTLAHLTSTLKRECSIETKTLLTYQSTELQDDKESFISFLMMFREREENESRRRDRHVLASAGERPWNQESAAEQYTTGRNPLKREVPLGQPSALTCDATSDSVKRPNVKCIYLHTLTYFL